MVDYSLDGNFELERTEWNDFETVDGLEEFEQDLAVSIHFRMKELLSGAVGSSSIKGKIRSQVYRVAQLYEVIEQISSVTVTRELAGENSYRVEVTYRTEQPFSEVF
jgi:hypothetical protein